MGLLCASLQGSQWSRPRHRRAPLCRPHRHPSYDVGKYSSHDRRQYPALPGLPHSVCPAQRRAIAVAVSNQAEEDAEQTRAFSGGRVSREKQTDGPGTGLRKAKSTVRKHGGNTVPAESWLRPPQGTAGDLRAGAQGARVRPRELGGTDAHSSDSIRGRLPALPAARGPPRSPPRSPTQCYGL